MGKISFRLEDRREEWWKVENSHGLHLDSGDSELLERDLYRKHLRDQDPSMENSPPTSEGGGGYTVSS